MADISVTPEQIDACRWIIASIRASQADHKRQAKMFESYVTDPELRTGALVFVIRALLTHMWLSGIDPDETMAQLAESAAMLG